MIMLLEGMFLGNGAIASEWVVGNLGWLTILVGNLFAVLAMGSWVWRRHPGLKEHVFGAHVAPQG